MNITDFMQEANARGKSREETLEAVRGYRTKYGAFDDDAQQASPSQALASMNESIKPQSPNENQMISDTLDASDEQEAVALRFYDRKYGVTHDNAMLTERLRLEYGDNATPEMANQSNKLPLAFYPSPTMEELTDDRSNPFTALFSNADLAAPDNKASLTRLLRDVAVGSAKTVVATSEAFMGLADLSMLQAHLITKGTVPLPSEGFRKIGFDPKKTQEIFGKLYSPETRGAIQQFGVQEGVLNKLGLALQNPSVIGTTVLESVGPMMLGGAVAKSVTFAGKLVAGGIGEGLVSGGMQLEEIVDYNAGDEVTPKQASLVAATTIATALIGAGSAKLQKTIGLADIDTLIAGGGGGVAKSIRNPAARVALGAFFEAFIEELPQGLQEQISTNLSTDKPWNEGLDDSAALGIIAGAAMGGGAQFAQSTPAPAKDLPTFKVGENELTPYTLGDANVLHNTKTPAELQEMVMELPMEAQDLAMDALTNPTQEKVTALNKELFAEDETASPEKSAKEPTPIAEEARDTAFKENLRTSDVVGISTDFINQGREARGKEKMTKAESKAHQKSMTEALDSGLVLEADTLANTVLRSAEVEGTKIYQMNDEEVASLGARMVELENERRGLISSSKSAMETGDQEASDLVDIELAQNSLKMDDIEFALATSSLESGRANSMMASMIHRFTYDIVSLEHRARKAKGENLTPQELADIQDVSTRIEGVEGQIADLKEQINTGEFKEKKRRKRKDEPKELTDLRTELEILQEEARHKIYKMTTSGIRETMKNVWTLPRSLMATADMSYGLRQGILPSYAHPVIASKAWGKAFKAFFSNRSAAQAEVEQKDHPLHAEIVRLGTYFSKKEDSVSKREEFFASNLAERIPLFGRLVKASERNMVTGLNLLRQGLMIDFLSKHPDASTEVKKAYAKYVNVATGRGEAKFLDGASEELSLLFFAPRFAYSRIQAPFLATSNIIKHPELRGEIIKQWSAMAGTSITILALAKMAGADVDEDPDNSDWGKIVVDNKHIDIFGGIQQPLRLVAKSIKGGGERITEGETDFDPIGDMGNFLKYKLSPPILMLGELMTGKDIIGRETEEIEVPFTDIELPTEATVFAKAMAPLIIQSVVEAYQEGEDPLVIAGLALGEGLGLSIGVYDKKSK